MCVSSNNNLSESFKDVFQTLFFFTISSIMLSGGIYVLLCWLLLSGVLDSSGDRSSVNFSQCQHKGPNVSLYLLSLGSKVYVLKHLWKLCDYLF